MALWRKILLTNLLGQAAYQCSIHQPQARELEVMAALDNTQIPLTTLEQLVDLPALVAQGIDPHELEFQARRSLSHFQVFVQLVAQAPHDEDACVLIVEEGTVLATDWLLKAHLLAEYFKEVQHLQVITAANDYLPDLEYYTENAEELAQVQIRTTPELIMRLRTNSGLQLQVSALHHLTYLGASCYLVRVAALREFILRYRAVVAALTGKLSPAQLAPEQRLNWRVDDWVEIFAGRMGLAGAALPVLGVASHTQQGKWRVELRQILRNAAQQMSQWEVSDLGGLRTAQEQTPSLTAQEQAGLHRDWLRWQQRDYNAQLPFLNLPTLAPTQGVQHVARMHQFVFHDTGLVQTLHDSTTLAQFYAQEGTSGFVPVEIPRASDPQVQQLAREITLYNTTYSNCGVEHKSELLFDICRKVAYRNLFNRIINDATIGDQEWVMWAHDHVLLAPQWQTKFNMVLNFVLPHISEVEMVIADHPRIDSFKWHDAEQLTSYGVNHHPDHHLALAYVPNFTHYANKPLTGKVCDHALRYPEDVPQSAALYSYLETVRAGVENLTAQAQESAGVASAVMHDGVGGAATAHEHQPVQLERAYHLEHGSMHQVPHGFVGQYELQPLEIIPLESISRAYIGLGCVKVATLRRARNFINSEKFCPSLLPLLTRMSGYCILQINPVLALPQRGWNRALHLSNLQHHPNTKVISPFQQGTLPVAEQIRQIVNGAVEAEPSAGINNLPIYVINLDFARERLENFANQVTSVAWNRVPAVYGKNLSFLDLVWCCSLDQVRKLVGRDLTWGEVGCTLSHLRTYAQILSNDAIAEDAWVLVCEDDTIFTQNWYSRLHSLLQYLNQPEMSNLELILLAHLVLTDCNKLSPIQLANKQFVFTTPQHMIPVDATQDLCWLFDYYPHGASCYIVRKRALRPLQQRYGMLLQWVNDPLISQLHAEVQQTTGRVLTPGEQELMHQHHQQARRLQDDHELCTALQHNDVQVMHIVSNQHQLVEPSSGDAITQLLESWEAMVQQDSQLRDASAVVATSAGSDEVQLSVATCVQGLLLLQELSETQLVAYTNSVVHSWWQTLSRWVEQGWLRNLIHGALHHGLLQVAGGAEREAGLAGTSGSRAGQDSNLSSSVSLAPNWQHLGLTSWSLGLNHGLLSGRSHTPSNGQARTSVVQERYLSHCLELGTQAARWNLQLSASCLAWLGYCNADAEFIHPRCAWVADDLPQVVRINATNYALTNPPLALQAAFLESELAFERHQLMRVNKEELQQEEFTIAKSNYQVQEQLFIIQKTLSIGALRQKFPQGQIVMRVDVESMSEAELDEVFDRAAFKRHYGREATLEEISSTLTHLKAWQAIALRTEGYHYKVILEDDVEVGVDFATQIDKVMQFIPHRMPLISYWVGLCGSSWYRGDAASSAGKNSPCGVGTQGNFGSESVSGSVSYAGMHPHEDVALNFVTEVEEVQPHACGVACRAPLSREQLEAQGMAIHTYLQVDREMSLFVSADEKVLASPAGYLIFTGALHNFQTLLGVNLRVGLLAQDLPKLLCDDPQARSTVNPPLVHTA